MEAALSRGKLGSNLLERSRRPGKKKQRKREPLKQELPLTSLFSQLTLLKNPQIMSAYGINPSKLSANITNAAILMDDLDFQILIF